MPWCAECNLLYPVRILDQIRTRNRRSRIPILDYETRFCCLECAEDHFSPLKENEYVCAYCYELITDKRQKRRSGRRTIYCSGICAILGRKERWYQNLYMRKEYEYKIWPKKRPEIPEEDLS